MKRKIYDVYFEKIKADKIRVKAFTKDDAIMRAKVRWESDNLYPKIIVKEKSKARTI